jgi:outer membrane protein assembly factor BamB
MRDIIFAAALKRVVRIDLSDGSVTQFTGDHTDLTSGWGDVMALSDDGGTLYFGSFGEESVIAFNVSTCQQIWTANVDFSIHSVSYHNGMVLVVGIEEEAEFRVLNAATGFLIRTMDIKAVGLVLAHTVIKGLWDAIHVLIDLIILFIMGLLTIVSLLII